MDDPLAAQSVWIRHPIDGDQCGGSGPNAGKSQLQELPTKLKPASPPNANLIFCTGCGYLLNGLRAASCPECGRTFNPLDATTFDRGTAGAGRWLYRERHLSGWLIGFGAFNTLTILLIFATEPWFAWRAPIAMTILFMAGPVAFVIGCFVRWQSMRQA
jgi:hypothetical protein